VALLNNLEFDHADIFENLAAVKKTFRHLIQTSLQRTVLCNGGSNLMEITRNVRSVGQEIRFGPRMISGRSYHS
jgi:UDP-N-acetylmuramate-alanine ligase